MHLDSAMVRDHGCDATMIRKKELYSQVESTSKKSVSTQGTSLNQTRDEIQLWIARDYVVEEVRDDEGKRGKIDVMTRYMYESST